MSLSLRIRLSAMMFLQLFAMGATMPIMGLYLKEHLHFTPAQIGQILALPSVAAFIAPFLAIHVADRLISAERMLALSQLASGAAMLLLSRQTEYWPFMAVFSLYAMLFVPTIGLSNAVVFHHLVDSKRDFGPLRLWGTIGWIAVAWAFGFFWIRAGGAGVSSARIGDALTVSALSSFLLGAFTLLLPKGHARAKDTLALRSTLRVLRRPSLLMLCLGTYLTVTAGQFYMQWMSPYLSQIGIAPEHIMPLLSLGQVLEIVAMASMGRVIGRLGIRRTLLLGMGLNLLRYAALALVTDWSLVVAAISMHGMAYAFFSVAAYIYLDSHCAPQERAGVQLVYHVVGMGFGQSSGSLLAGYVAQFLAEPSGDIRYPLFWLVPAGISLVLLLAFAAFFREEATGGHAKIGQE